MDALAMQLVGLRANRRLDFCVVHHGLRVVYAYIPKAACTNIKTWLLRVGKSDDEFVASVDRAIAAGKLPGQPGFPCVHEYCERNASLKQMPGSKADAILADDRYFKFTIVRHPLRRLVSAYLNKVVHTKSCAARLIRNSQIRTGVLRWDTIRNLWSGPPAIDTERSLTFREFVLQLTLESPYRVDPHFRAQSKLLAGLRLDFVGRLEQLDAHFGVVQKHLGIDAPLPGNSDPSGIRGERQQDPAGCVADWPAAMFRASRAPAWQWFFDDAVLAMAKRLYADDFLEFAYHADASVPNGGGRAAGRIV
jgi:hypothetical protein